MSKRFTYSGDPSTSPTDEVRFLVGDTNEKIPLLDDREVEWAISQQPDRMLAAALLADSLFGKFAAMADLKVGPVSKNYSKVAELFKKKADQLRLEANKFAAPSFPAIAYATKDALAQDDSLTRPSFLRGMNDSPYAIQIDGYQLSGFCGFL